MPLVIGRQSPLRTERVRVFWLFVKVRSIVDSLGNRVASGKGNLIREPSIQGQRQTVVNRTGVVFPLVNVIELRCKSCWGEHKPPKLLRKGIGNPEAQGIT